MTLLLVGVISVGIKPVTAKGKGVEPRPMGVAALPDSMDDVGTAHKRGVLIPTGTPDALGAMHPSLKAGKGAELGSTEGGVVVVVVWCPLAFCSGIVFLFAGVGAWWFMLFTTNGSMGRQQVTRLRV